MTTEPTTERTTEPAPASQPSASPRRRMGSVPDMVRSLAVVLLLVGVIALITLRPDTGDGSRVIEYGSELSAARAAAPYEVLAPAGLQGFQATSVRYNRDGEATVWHLGFVTPAGAYVGVDQTDGPAEPFVADLTEDAEPVAGNAGPVELAGRSWERYDYGGSSDDERVRGLLSMDETVVTLVSGTAEWPELEAMAAALTSE